MHFKKTNLKKKQKQKQIKFQEIWDHNKKVTKYRRKQATMSESGRSAKLQNLTSKGCGYWNDQMQSTK